VSSRRPIDFQQAQEQLDVNLDLASEDAPKYLQWIADLCGAHLGERTLEIGAGHGAVTEKLVSGRNYVATDIWEPSVERLQERFAGAPNVSAMRYDVLKDPAPGVFDSVLMINVLEHLPDDLAVLHAVHDTLADGGNVVLYVPAFEFLYCEFDRQAGHYRRYTKKSLSKALKEAGFTVTAKRYVNAPSVPIWFVFSRLMGMDPGAGWSRRAWDKYLIPVVRRVEAVVKPPFGLTMLMVGTKGQASDPAGAR
jgi:SAM-dependent methyltransferase